MYRSLFPRDLFAEIDRLQREMRRPVTAHPASAAWPAATPPERGATPKSVEIYAFAPGIDPVAIECRSTKGVLTIAGERQETLPGADEKTHCTSTSAGRALPARR